MNEPVRYTLWHLVSYMLGLGTWGFGGVDGVTAAAIGAIAGAVIVIAQRSISDWITAALAVATALVLWRFKKVPEPAIVLVAALIGLVVYPLVPHR